jgi:peptide/nickel transport system ATP-binding protein
VDKLLEVDNLRVEYTTSQGSFEAVKDISFSVARGETLAIVGESGSGKSTVASAVNMLLSENGRISEGSIVFDGRNMQTLGKKELVSLRGAGIGLVPQDPMSNLNPMHRVGKQIEEALEVHGHTQKGGSRKRTLELLEAVGIPSPESRVNQYPHEFSGGMRQRVLIAIGLACNPKLLIADEPTSALDVTVQQKILDILERLTGKLHTSVLLITHDLSLAAERADRILVMQKGEIVEQGPAQEIVTNPRFAYTRELISAVPRLDHSQLEARSPREQKPRGQVLITFDDAGKSFRKLSKQDQSDFWATRHVTFDICEAETVSIVGESGSGKSTAARMLLGLEDISEGEITLFNKQLGTMSSKEHFEVRRQIQPVFQNPFGSLDPRYTIGRTLSEPLKVHRLLSGTQRQERVKDLLEQVALPEDVINRLPNQLSGGQRQRVAIARALSLEPRVLVLDEAVSALDVLVQNQILELLVRLQQELGLSYLFISHDLAVVNMISNMVHVMKEGSIVESGTPQEIFQSPEHEYTKKLLASVPRGLETR